MSISGINNYNYQNYYAGARHNMAKTGGEIRACCQVPVVHLLILHYICQMEATVEML